MFGLFNIHVLRVAINKLIDARVDFLNLVWTIGFAFIARQFIQRNSGLQALISILFDPQGYFKNLPVT